MAITASGFMTITDVADGAPSISIFQTNENHTFTATTDGTVSDFSGYNNDLIVFVAGTQAAYVTTTPTVNNTYTVGARTPNPTGSITVDSPKTNSQARSDGGTGNINVARLEVSSYPKASGDATVTIPITIRRNNVNVVVNVVMSFSKAKGGSGESLNLYGSRMTFGYTDSDSTTASTDGDITLTADYAPAGSGSFTWKRTVILTNGTVENQQNVTGTISTQTVTATDFNTAATTSGNVGKVAAITYEVTRGQLTDTFTIGRLNNGATTYQVVPLVTAGSSTLKNNSGSVTFGMQVFKGGTKESSLTGWSFAYNGPPANDRNGTRKALTSADTGITVGTYDGSTTGQIQVAAAYVENGYMSTITVTGTKS